MLRDYFYGTKAIMDILLQFEGIDFDHYKDIMTQLAKPLSPDSFIWKLSVNGQRYYLYAEDFLENIQHVYREIEKIAGEGSGELVPVKQQTEFDDLAAVKSVAVYKEPDDYETEMKKYAASSGYDLVFLYKVHPPTNKRIKGTVNG